MIKNKKCSRPPFERGKETVFIARGIINYRVNEGEGNIRPNQSKENYFLK